MKELERQVVVVGGSFAVERQQQEAQQPMIILPALIEPPPPLRTGFREGTRETNSQADKPVSRNWTDYCRESTR